MRQKNDAYIFQKVARMTPRAELAPSVCSMLPEIDDVQWQEPNPIVITPAKQGDIACEQDGGHYFMGGLPALMQAVRLLEKEPTARVTYVNDGQLKKSTQSAHQGHVHPTEWTTPELGSWQLAKILLRTAGILPKIPPEDLLRYSYIHFPLSKMRLGLMIRNMGFRLIHTLLSKNGVSQDDRWQCDAVRASLAFHKRISDEIQRSGDAPTFSEDWRLIWSPDREGIERKCALWHELGIKTEPMSNEDLRSRTLLKDTASLYGLKVLGDGKFFPDVDQKIVNYLAKKYPNNFQARTAAVSRVYEDEITHAPFAVSELFADGTSRNVAVDSFYGSCGHNKVFRQGLKKPLWNEVPVSGVSTLWVCNVEKSALLERFGVQNMLDDVLIERVRQFVGAANLTNMHTTIWNACVDGDKVHIVLRATQGANFNSEFADPDDLVNMKANIDAYFIGSWQLITAGSCTRKTATANVPVLKDHFVHGLSGIGFSFSAAPKEMLLRSGLAPSSFKIFE